MAVFLIAAVLVFAMIQRRKHLRIYRQNKCGGWPHRWNRGQAQTDESDDVPGDKWDKWSRQWQDWEHWAQDAGRRAGDAGNKVASKLRSAGAATRREAGGPRNPAGNVDSSPRAPGTGEFSADRERTEREGKAYHRARRRAAREAGFYVHLMWYAIVIGSCLLVNLIVSPSFEWWIFPAVGWGIGLVSHFGAVYGWHWIHERVFEPAIRREVQREVTIEKEAMRTEKQASLDELTASFAHEIRNPIAAAKSLVQQMGEDPTSNENVEYARVALDELARVERSVSHLLKYAKEEDYSFDNVNLASVLDNALTQLRAKLEAREISVSRNYIGGPTVRADADKLRQVFTNVIDNAIDSMESNTSERRLELGIRNQYPGTATVVIRDTGCGIPEDKLSRIFNPFYTTKKNGTGLGMGVAKKVMDAHRGLIELQSKVGAGTEFRLSIPLSDAARLWTKPLSSDSSEMRSPSEPLRAASTSAETGAAPDPATAIRADSRDRQ
jgi:signal transduction histidine kinase